jgi:hypothetical protein
MRTAENANSAAPTLEPMVENWNARLSSRYAAKKFITPSARPHA